MTLLLFHNQLIMSKKERRLVPESELTEEEVRRWFNRLRELYQEALHNIHSRKVERWELRVKICNLQHEIAVLKKENEKLRSRKEEKKKIEWGEKLEKSDFKKKFFDSL